MGKWRDCANMHPQKSATMCITIQEEELVEGVRETVLYKYASTVISAIQSLIQYKKRNWKKGVGERDVTICIHKVWYKVWYNTRRETGGRGVRRSVQIYASANNLSTRFSFQFLRAHHLMIGLEVKFSMSMRCVCINPWQKISFWPAQILQGKCTDWTLFTNMARINFYLLAIEQ